MTKQELISRLKEISERVNFDPVGNHIEADDLLLDYIGSRSVTKYFDEIEKLYS